MWTVTFVLFCLFTHVTKLYLYTCSCMFAHWILRLPVGLKSENHNPDFFESNENVKSPKKYSRMHKEGRAITARPVYHLFLLLPRMVASGLAACFMNAEGLMPTMFLNCLEKW